MVLIYLFIFYLICHSSSGSHFLSNGITANPVITCASNEIIFFVNTTYPFYGKIFVKGYSTDSNCYISGKSTNSLKINLNFESCGLRRSREINGLSVTTTIIVSFHPMFITKIDRAFKVNCFYTEPIKRVAQKLNVSDVPIESLKVNAPLPTCKYEILDGSSDGKPIRFVKIGDIVYHKWSCTFDELINEPPRYCILVHSCLVNDGQGGDDITVIDKRGCEIDGYILKKINYVNDMEAGQTSNVFKFADKNSLVFNCQISLTVRDQMNGCSGTQPICVTSTAIPNKGIPSIYSISSTNYEMLQNYPTADDNNKNELQINHVGIPSLSNYNNNSNNTYKTNSFNNNVIEVPPSVYVGEEESDDNNEYIVLNGVKTIFNNITTRQQNGLRHVRKIRKIADFDLPEQTLIVLGIEDTLSPIPYTSSKF
ncbi:Zona pellucida domain-containing protein [Strongyloides ratti]|uniref:Zona pellucida domain-containing protein n=1 Tax=Strongyloides ratti TaxID=34506 RepID=A0A090KZN5_STRRB|nr:Zona pellucida domain-containing protein [Strongyloides ratti]CEF62891.1 Zona pellucida domain-containing protein [Strongyloides ratti]